MKEPRLSDLLEDLILHLLRSIINALTGRRF